MNTALKTQILNWFCNFELGKHVGSPYFNQLGIQVRNSTENKIMSQNSPPVIPLIHHFPDVNVQILKHKILNADFELSTF